MQYEINILLMIKLSSNYLMCKYRNLDKLKIIKQSISQNEDLRLKFF